VLAEPSDFCRLILLRHPELAPEYQNRAVGASSAKLSRRGVAQLSAWSDRLEGSAVTIVHAGDVEQTRDPARVLADRLDCDLAIDDRLLDQRMGSWEGQSWEQVMQQEGSALRSFFAEFGEAAPPDGESLGHAVERMLAWWKEQAPTSLGKSIAAVLPGSLVAGFAAAMLGMRLSRSISLALPHGGMGVLDIYANGAKLSAWNVGAWEERA